MKSILFSGLILFLTPCAIFACSDLAEKTDAYLEENYSAGEEENKPRIKREIRHLSPELHLVQLSITQKPAEDAASETENLLLIFRGIHKCDVPTQWDGELVEFFPVKSAVYLHIQNVSLSDEDISVNHSFVRVFREEAIDVGKDSKEENLEFSDNYKISCNGKRDGNWTEFQAAKDFSAVTVISHEVHYTESCRLKESNKEFSYFEPEEKIWRFIK